MEDVVYSCGVRFFVVGLGGDEDEDEEDMVLEFVLDIFLDKFFFEDVVIDFLGLGIFFRVWGWVLKGIGK